MIIKKQLSHAKMDEKYTAPFAIRSMLFVYIAIDIWFASARDIAQRIHSYQKEAMKMGQMDVAMLALRNTWRHLLLGGEKLPLIAISAEKHLRPMVSRYLLLLFVRNHG